jgi:HD superfamily phosphodiesterase
MDYEKLERKILSKLKEELPKGLYYHNVQHTLYVIEKAEEIISNDKPNVSKYEVTLLKTAALLHDWGFIKQYDSNEVLAAEYAKEILPNYGYNDNEIEQIYKMILSTQFPPSPASYLEEILCDADLFYLGTKEFEFKSNELRKELKHFKDLVFTEEEWLDFELKFLKSHRYFNDYAIEQLKPLKKSYINELSERYNSIKGN